MKAKAAEERRRCPQEPENQRNGSDTMLNKFQNPSPYPDRPRSLPSSPADPSSPDDPSGPRPLHRLRSFFTGRSTIQIFFTGHDRSSPADPRPDLLHRPRSFFTGRSTSRSSPADPRPDLLHRPIHVQIFTGHDRSSPGDPRSRSSSPATIVCVWVCFCDDLFG
ncbi:hypothetical protein SO802_018522 [Lithocarpus litseifolius]|uniref:Uncharacterized protein n=1 Tax=Lithocarpus litseifolius TaxID=425828 RepID=A0AAW2CL76_9ROSI